MKQCHSGRQMFRKICTDVLCIHSSLNKQVASHKMRNASQRFTNVTGSNRVDEKEKNIGIQQNKHSAVATNTPEKWMAAPENSLLQHKAHCFVRTRRHTDLTGGLRRTPDGGRHFGHSPTKIFVPVYEKTRVHYCHSLS